ncbi:MAG: hypothetical protein AVDCRST_MAG74-3923 [uncultured Pyrinomonadaceae bacterium]|uniref:Uncharacterized protein n=1 Tax=uncultured Pyrinomonadaceae bacterium TaxID=2283094 RepID=A0A6J4Q612_9BACT|nr:MAG: hypothetical protein AVDCRST_MAG74-3923 [uncultured Pyrinomonadaceae bacterium]
MNLFDGVGIPSTPPSKRENFSSFSLFHILTFNLPCPD